MRPSVVRHRSYLRGAFLVEHHPAGIPRRGPAIVILPSLGYEDTCAYRPLRVLADTLAQEGHVVVRVDWPGLGDSVGDDASPDLVPQMIAVVGEVVASLRARGASQVAGIGLRAGALFALTSAGFDDLVLWAPPLTGKAFLREERAFHKMAERYFGTTPEAVAPVPEGAVEAGGFLYRAETVAALEALAAAPLVATAGLTRVLLIPRDGADPPPALLAAFGAAGTAVVLGPAEGLADLLENPYQSTVLPSVQDAILRFFAGGDAGPPIPPPPRGAPLALPGGVTEMPWVADGATGQLSGIVCLPAGGAKAGAAWTVFYNAGGIRRSGPNRLWTLAARRLAAQGTPSLRFDVHDVGDSDGATLPHHDLDEMYSPATMDDAVRAIDAVGLAGGSAVDVVGLCSGAFFAVHAADRRPVRRALLINGPAYVWNEEARTAGVTSQVTRSLLDGRRWKRLLTGRIDRRFLVEALTQESARTVTRAWGRLRGAAPPDEVTELIRRVEGRGTRLHFLCSEGDPCIAYLDAHLAPDAAARRTVIPGVDHTIRPLWAHARVLDLIVGPHFSD